MINYEINRLINFALSEEMIHEDDIIYSTNLLLGLLKVDEFYKVDVVENLDTPTPILENILDYAVDKNLIENTTTQRDLFDTQIMNCVMPRPSEVIKTFNKLYIKNKKQATNYYYNLSIQSNYIRKSRTDKNIKWKTKTNYGDLDITINLSKPEKDPNEILKAKITKSASYPKCLLCKENEGFFGNINYPSRQNHRIIPIYLSENKWFIQYSPYVYYNEHCIIFNEYHEPMKINENTFRNLFNLVDKFPHYFIGSNADLPIVGGSILSHEHYQGGNYIFPMEIAKEEMVFKVNGYENIKLSTLKWPMSVIRLSGKNKNEIIALASKILKTWKTYSDKSIDIISQSNGEVHNTITPIARKKNNMYELDLVLRNNRSNEENPFGIFHPHEDVHHIKKENIGLIEVMGLAVLPARLEKEINILKGYLLNKVSDINDDEFVRKHGKWYNYIIDKYNYITKENVDDILKEEIGVKFLTALSHAGVFKRDDNGIKAFTKFIKLLD
nr:UDP-glucose--hexose-1-phosphate uridylyltransferase [[Eubacterium] tenue]